jgi:hypothetical protein
MELGHLQFGDQKFALEDAVIYGIFEKYGQMSWYIELFPEGEENYMIFNALMFENIVNPKALSQVQVQVRNKQVELGEHKVMVKDEEYLLHHLQLQFGNWDQASRTIQVRGEGKIGRYYEQKTLDCWFEACCNFDGIRLFETSRDEVDHFIAYQLKADKQALKLSFEEAPMGLECVIEGQF